MRCGGGGGGRGEQRGGRRGEETGREEGGGGKGRRRRETKQKTHLSDIKRQPAPDGLEADAAAFFEVEDVAGDGFDRLRLFSLRLPVTLSFLARLATLAVLAK